MGPPIGIVVGKLSDMNLSEICFNCIERIVICINIIFIVVVHLFISVLRIVNGVCNESL